jgi:hypothetical protein
MRKSVQSTAGREAHDQRDRLFRIYVPDSYRRSAFYYAMATEIAAEKYSVLFAANP